MTFEQHCQECEAKLGSSYEEVQRWLDAFARSERHGTRHRKVRHHLAGIEEAGRLFGKGAAEAARLHFVADLRDDGGRGRSYYRRTSEIS